MHRLLVNSGRYVAPRNANVGKIVQYVTRVTNKTE